MVEGAILNTAAGPVAIWRDGDAWGRSPGGVKLSVNGHGVERFRKRVRPDLPLGHCAAELQKLAATALLAYRLNKRRDGTWYLLCGGEVPFTMLARLSMRARANFVTPVWRLITVMAGHEHW